MKSTRIIGKMHRHVNESRKENIEDKNKVKQRIERKKKKESDLF